MSEPVAVVGMACRFPGAENLDEYWNLIRTGRVATAPVSPQRWRHAWLYAADDPRAADFAYTDIVAHLPDVYSFPMEHYPLAPRRLEVTDPQHRLMIVLTDDALRDAGLTAFPNRRTDVYIGASAAEYRDLLTARLRARQMAAGEFGTPLDADAARATVAGIAPPRSYTMPGTLLNMAAAAVSSAFDLGGASLVVDAACASALLALHEAVMHLRVGHCDLAIAGGVYLNLVPDNLVAFSRIGAVSPRGVCRPFDRRADGFVLGEGAGVVVLKRLTDAVAAGDGVYAVIRGVGCSNDGRAEGPMTPRLGGQVASLRRAYRDADVDPATVGFVECHGTATPAGDAVELAALREVFGQDASAHVSSVKANIGHTMSAAGIAGLIKAALVLRHGTVPPQVGCDEPDPALGTFRISRATQPWTASSDALRRAGVSSFGFGGTNVHVVLEEATGAVSGPGRCHTRRPDQRRRGTGRCSKASRVASGERPLHRELEASIAELLGAEAALTLVSGYATNLGVIGQLLRRGDLALHDELTHDSIMQGIRLSGARRQPFPHNDLVALDRLLRELAPRHPRVLVAVEGVYSMDGDLADLAGLVELRRQYGFMLYLDEAHSLGVLGATGRGALEHWGVQPRDVDIMMGTLSKALASCGGYVAGEARLIEYLRYTTPGFVYSVGLPPAAAGAAVAALGRLRAEPERVARLRANTELFRRRATEAGLEVGPGPAPVVPFLTGTSTSALLLADRMRQRGVNVQPIVYPAVPDAAARLRFFLNTSHTDAHIDEAVAILAQETAPGSAAKTSAV